MPSINSIQRGTITIPATGATSATATVTSVDVSKSKLTLLGGSNYDAGLIVSYPRIVLTNSTTITASIVNGSGTVATVVPWELTEYV